MSVDDVVEILAIDPIGVVPYDESIVVATNEGNPVVGTAEEAGRAYSNICHRLMGEEVPFLELSSEGFFKKLGKLFKRGY